jgi:predicted transcriptional regulator
MYTLPQEIEVWYVIPAIRRELSRLLTTQHGLSYEKTGNALGISKAAISQYQKNKRAGKIKLNPKVLKEVEKSAKLISNDNNKTVKEILRVLNFMREKKLTFEICENNEDCKEASMIYEVYWK